MDESSRSWTVKIVVVNLIVAVVVVIVIIVKLVVGVLVGKVAASKWIAAVQSLRIG